MSRNRLPRPMFVLGDFVFAKVHGYRAWPARVLGRHGTSTKIKYSVFFYGTCNTAKVPSSDIFDYENNQSTLGVLRSKNTARNADFRAAMAHAQQSFARPENDFVFYQVLARMKRNGDEVAYEILSPTTESDSVADSSGEDSEDSKTSTEPLAQATEQPQTSEDADRISKEVDSQQEGPRPAKKLKSMPLLEGPDLTENRIAEGTEPEKLGGDEYIFSDLDSDSFELEGNPIVGHSLAQYSESVTMSRFLGQPLRKEDDEDSALGVNEAGWTCEPENDQPINLSCRHVTADEQ